MKPETLTGAGRGQRGQRRENGEKGQAGQEDGWPCWRSGACRLPDACRGRQEWEATARKVGRPPERGGDSPDSLGIAGFGMVWHAGLLEAPGLARFELEIGIPLAFPLA